jgi:hypothetical protein
MGQAVEDPEELTFPTFSDTFYSLMLAWFQIPEVGFKAIHGMIKLTKICFITSS